MGRARSALAGAVIASAVVAAVPGMAAAKFKYTHTVSVTGSWVDHWTVSDSGLCAVVGDGTVTVNFRSRSPAKVFVAPPGPHNVRWIFVAPFGSFHQPADLAAKPAVATIERTDNTTMPIDDGDCGTLDKSGCGTVRMKGATVKVLGVDRKRIKTGLNSDQFDHFPGNTNCRIGTADQFNVVPCVPEPSDLFARMPSPRKFRHRHTVTVTTTQHKTCSFLDPTDAVVTDDMTRTITVTFTRL